MRNKSVAVLDIRSSEICAAIAERGVNGTFKIKSKYSRSYEGYAEGALLDEKDFFGAVHDAVKTILSSAETSVKKFYIGLPDEFCKVIVTDKITSFKSEQKITKRHVEFIKQSSVPIPEKGYTVIKCSPLYYVLSDKRKFIDPVNISSDSVRASLSYFCCKTSFMQTVTKAFEDFPSVRLFGWIPHSLAQSNYLLTPEEREGGAILFDLGYISSTFTYAYGGGIFYSEAFSVGVGHMAVLLMEDNVLGVPYDVAVGLMKQINLNAKDRRQASEEYFSDGVQYKFPSNEVCSFVREGLDGLCEIIESCRQNCGDAVSDLPVRITGEGVGVIRGTLEHLSNRLVTAVETVAPKVPYYDKPQYSSLFSLLSAALDEE